ncbi:hypothetical protein Dsin_001764 [Dipteronia sinensis]|uniref:DUF4283 domain-containing protein n=1 Tax=Dipteronia sinensis TaxID=43782 RepID=A0AAE0EIN0_9ROSI|nr:hypothetical protein Dsin_001764 [Dipteronia sinensis]
MDPMSMEASLYVTSSARSSVVPSRLHVSLHPHGGDAVDGWADPLLGSSSLSVRGSLPRCEDVVGMGDPFVGGSLPMSSIRGSSFTDLFKVAPIQVDNVSGPLILSKKGGYMVVRVDPSTYKSRLEVCKFSLIGRVVLSSGKKPWKLVDLKAKLQSVWKLNSVWRLISLGKGYFHIMLNSYADKNMVWSLGSLNLKPGVLRLQPWIPNFNPALQKSSNAQNIRISPALCSTCSSIGHFPNACRWNKSGKGILVPFFDGSYYFGGDCSGFSAPAEGAGQGDDSLTDVLVVAIATVSREQQQSRSVNAILVVSRSSVVVPVSNILVVHDSQMDIGSDLSVGLSAGLRAVFSEICVFYTADLLWFVLLSLCLVSSSWLVVGDFNAALGAHESLGLRSPARSSCEDFRSIIEDCDLIGVRSQGARFTWARGRYPRTKVERRTLVLYLFGFQSMWLDRPDFMDIVRRIWSSSFMGKPPQVVINKLKRLKNALKTWNWEVFGDLNSNITRKSVELKSIQLQMSNLEFSVVEDVIPSLVTDVENIFLISIPSTDDIHDVVFAMDVASAPGPDGFSEGFYQRCWEVVGSDVVVAVQDFFRTGFIFQLKDSILIDQFRLIVLSNFLFKISSKIFTDRSAQIATRIVCPHQFRFIQDRHIQDYIALASDYMNVMHKKSYGGNLAMKIDICKA